MFIKPNRFLRLISRISIVLFVATITGFACSNHDATDNPTDANDSAQNDAVDALSGNETAPSVEWISIPAGEFTFGSPEDTPCRAPIPETQFRVRLTRPFEIAATEITQTQWEALDFPNASLNVGADKPVTVVSFYEAAAWCNKLSRKEGLDTCYNLASCRNAIGSKCPNEEYADEYGCANPENVFQCSANIHKYPDYSVCPGYRLPTTAEWEYAAKAGTTGHTYNGDVHYVALSYCEEEPALEDIAWYCNNSGGELHPVKQKKPNPWGLYDTLGNVYEWTDYYFHGQALDVRYDEPNLILVDPTGPISGTTMEVRGGVFNKTGCYVTPGRPFFHEPHHRMYHTGFRPVRTLFGAEAEEANKKALGDSDSQEALDTATTSTDSTPTDSTPTDSSSQADSDSL